MPRTTQQISVRAQDQETELGPQLYAICLSMSLLGLSYVTKGRVMEAHVMSSPSSEN